MPELLPLSALQHLLFCERQAMLIHAEQLWAENRLTVEGQHLHQKAHSSTSGWRNGVYIARGLHLASERLGLVGAADVVELTPPLGDSQVSQPLRLTCAELSRWSILLVEYKRGRAKKDHSDRVQLCAQAICLEEMLQVSIGRGSLFYGEKRRRVEVLFDVELRTRTADAANRLHQLFAAGVTPRARRESKCDSCSLLHLCLPAAAARGNSTSSFVRESFRKHLAAEAPATDPQL
ncbi:CRISPR-associated protein Cas4 [Anatilimnocola floriformis]|uniref:CRISPR-associated protein Cas4 n=1 Tax=Anatilimnocola floriformis TaxID=2948575 RepID=UPI0036F2D934